MSNNLYNTKLYTYRTNKNMKCLLIPLKNSNTVTVAFMIPAGSREEKNAFGIAHFLEHMTFKGTKHKTSTKLMIELDSIGCHYNAMTSYEYTIYYISGDPKDIKIILNTIIDLYLYPTYPEEDIEKERKVVLEEYRMSEDNNHRVLVNKIKNEIFKNVDETLARPIIGFYNTIEKFTREDIINYRNDNYNINKCLLCVSGNFNKKYVKKIIKKKFESKLKKFNYFPKTITNKKIINLMDLDKNISRTINVYKDINQSIIYFYFNIFDKYNTNIYIIELLCNILSNGFSSRLFNLLRNKMGVSYYNNSFTNTFTNFGFIIINVGVENSSLLYTIEEILKELNSIKNIGFTIEELNRAKKQYNTHLLFQLKDPYEYLMLYGMNIIDNVPNYSLSDYKNIIDKISLNEINNLSKNIFNNKNFVIGTIGKISDSQINKINELINNSFTS